MALSESSLSVGLLAGGALSLTLFNLPITVLGSGMLACVIGVAGRAAFDMQQAFKHGDVVRMTRIFGWVGAGLLGAPMATVSVMVGYQAYFKTEPGGLTALALLALGFGGQDLVGPIWNRIAKVLNRKFDLDMSTTSPKDDLK